ncbi:MAG: hypothetical protein BZY88_20485 [SAR202 cluster bacterium Io17-Chloro-G9]|nr:MAG: hypothetical protein BZY88_20485 [SAR202 cluster bacterium Io17-Chloro-G9]
MAIGWGFIGTGRYPDRSGAPAMALAKDTNLVATYSRDMGRAEGFAKKHGFQAAYDSLEDLLGDSRVDAVFISSPNHLHASYTQMAANAGKHVLVEKPMSLTVDEGVDMVRACRANGVRLGVGFQLRYHPGHTEASRLVREGVLGGIALAQVQIGGGTRGELSRAPRTGLSEWWEHPEMVGGSSTMIGAGIHALDDLHHILGQTVVELAAITDGQTADSPMESLATMCLRFDGGAIATLCCSSRVPDFKNDVTIYGNVGNIVLKDSSRPTFAGSLEVSSETVNTAKSYEPDALSLFTWQTEAFNAAIQQGEDPPASGIAGLKAVQVTAAMIESASTGKTVKLEPLPVS